MIPLEYLWRPWIHLWVKLHRLCRLRLSLKLHMNFYYLYYATKKVICVVLSRVFFLLSVFGIFVRVRITIGESNFTVLVPVSVSHTVVRNAKVVEILIACMAKAIFLSSHSHRSFLAFISIPCSSAILSSLSIASLYIGRYLA